MATKKFHEWLVCSLCGGDGIANTLPDEDGHSEEGTCPQCNGTGYNRRESYLEFDEEWFEDRVTEAVSAHPEWFEERIIQAFLDNKETIRDVFKQWMRDVLAE